MRPEYLPKPAVGRACQIPMSTAPTLALSKVSVLLMRLPESTTRMSSRMAAPSELHEPSSSLHPPSETKWKRSFVRAWVLNTVWSAVVSTTPVYVARFIQVLPPASYST